jgi:hypothetical protein
LAGGNGCGGAETYTTGGAVYLGLLGVPEQKPTTIRKRTVLRIVQKVVLTNHPKKRLHPQNALRLKLHLRLPGPIQRQVNDPRLNTNLPTDSPKFHSEDM